MPHAHVAPVRTRTFSPDLGCDVARVVAYRAVCTCGWRGSSHDDRTNAAADAGLHRESCPATDETTDPPVAHGD